MTNEQFLKIIADKEKAIKTQSIAIKISYFFHILLKKVNVLQLYYLLNNKSYNTTNYTLYDKLFFL